MSGRLACIAFNTFREAVRDRVLYNLVLFALLMVGAALLFGQISIGIERLVLTNLGLTAISMFGIMIAVFLGIGLVSKEIDKRTLYTVLAHPVRRWEFVVGKFFGLAGTLALNTMFMAIGFFAALLYVAHHFTRADLNLVTAIYFIVLQFIILTAVALLFSSFSTPILSAVYSIALFVAGCFAGDLRSMAGATHGISHWLLITAAYALPNFAGFNVISSVAHGATVAGSTIALNTLYALVYCTMTVSGAVLVFEKRNLK